MNPSDVHSSPRSRPLRKPSREGRPSFFRFPPCSHLLNSAGSAEMTKSEEFLMRNAIAFASIILLLAAAVVSTSSAEPLLTAKIHWDHSIDKPYLQAYRLYWKMPGATEWSSVDLKPDNNFYEFITTVPGIYQFRMTAVDKRGLESVPTATVRGLITEPMQNLRMVPTKPKEEVR